MGIDPSNEGVQSDWTAYHLQGCKRHAGNAKGGHIACKRQTSVARPFGPALHPFAKRRIGGNRNGR